MGETMSGGRKEEEEEEKKGRGEMSLNVDGADEKCVEKRTRRATMAGWLAGWGWGVPKKKKKERKRAVCV